MNSQEWEEHLVFHYLSSEGPGGEAPLDHIDATPPELAQASGLVGQTPEAALDSFKDVFTRRNTSVWLTGRFPALQASGSVPGCFRFLVLTCLAVQLEQEDSNEFQHNLGNLIDGRGLFRHKGVKDLWLALREWIESRRARGEPFRELVLPPEDPYRTQMGYTFGLAFPNWKDRKEFGAVLEKLPWDSLSSPRRFVAEMERSAGRRNIPSRLQIALDEFREVFWASGRFGAQQHRFWRLVESIRDGLEPQEIVKRRQWRLLVRFSGYASETVDASLLGMTRHEHGADPLWSGPFEALVGEVPQSLPTGLQNSLNGGLLVLGLLPDEKFGLEPGGPSESPIMIVMRRDGVPIPPTLPETHWTNLKNGWLVSHRFATDSLRHYLARSDTELSDAFPEEFTISGGVRTARNVWLGRQGCLPKAHVAQGGSVVFEDAASAKELMVVREPNDTWSLRAPVGVSGRWNLLLQRDGTAPIRKALRLDRDGPDFSEWQDGRSAFDEIKEIQDGNSPWTPTAPTATDFSPADGETSDLAEALYTLRRAKGVSQVDIVSLVDRFAPEPRMRWDILRGFAEAGFLEPRLSRTWGSMLWFPNPPRFLQLGKEVALVEGAIGALMKRRLLAKANDQGVEVLGSDRGEFSPELLLAKGPGLRALAKALSWPLKNAVVPRFLVAPHCWHVEPRTADGYQVRFSWSFKEDGFRDDISPLDGPLRLDWLARERRDARDLYRISDQTGTFLTASRAVALLEAHRRVRRPLFAVEDGRLVRTAKEGYLPLVVARYLRARCLSASGLFRSANGTFSYSYPISDEVLTWIGWAVDAPSHGKPREKGPWGVKTSVQSRRTGLRRTWPHMSVWK